MKEVKIIMGAVASLVVVYLFAAPYLTAYQMQQAADHRDGEALSKHVDFPALRQSLKDQMNVMLAKEMNKGLEENPFAAMGAVLGGMMVEKMVDAYVTPAGLTSLLNGEQPHSKPHDDGASSNSSSEERPRVSLAYESLSTFSITPDNQNGMKLVLSRRGIGWKLTEVILPL